MAASTDAAFSWSIGGFGTLGVVTTDEREADFVDTRTQPHGAGATQQFAFGPDSKLGLQLDAKYGNLSGVLQIVSQLQHDGTYTPHIEWANLKYQITPDWDVRAGRVALPVLIESDYRLVGLSNTTIRPPIEAYAIIPDTSITGIDTTWRHRFGPATNSIQALYGSFSANFPEPHSALHVPRSGGLSDTLDFGPVLFHASLAYASLVYADPSTDALNSGLVQFGDLLESIPGLAPQGAQALALERSYATDGQHTRITSVGVSYDQASWIALSEWVRLTNAGFIPTSTAEYLTVGYRVGRFTPYATISALKSQTFSPAYISTQGLPPPLAAAASELNSGEQSLLFQQENTQTTRSLGLRYDLRSNLDLKFQIDRISLGAGTPGLLLNFQPNFVPGSSLYVYSFALDFVF